MKLQQQANSTESSKITLHPVEPYMASWNSDTYHLPANVLIDAEERCDDWDFVRYRATLSEDRKTKLSGLQTLNFKRGDVVYLFEGQRGEWPT